MLKKEGAIVGSIGCEAQDLYKSLIFTSCKANFFGVSVAKLPAFTNGTNLRFVKICTICITCKKFLTHYPFRVYKALLCKRVWNYLHHL